MLENIKAQKILNPEFNETFLLSFIERAWAALSLRRVDMRITKAKEKYLGVKGRAPRAIFRSHTVY